MKFRGIVLLGVLLLGSAFQTRSLWGQGVPGSEGQLLRPQVRTIESGTTPQDALSMRLAPPSEKAATAADASRGTASSLLNGSFATIIGALTVTLAVFAGFVLISRRSGSAALSRSLPREGVEVIGQTMLGQRQKLIVVRCGVQALVIGVSPNGMQTLAQLDDPDEAGQFIAQCRGLGSTASFRTTLRELEREPVSPGFVESTSTGGSTAGHDSRRGKLFLRA